MGLVLFAAMLFGIFVLGSHPDSANLFVAPIDKFVHAGIFALIAISIKISWPVLNWLVVLLISACIGLADELHQFLVPGRQPGWDDGIADIIGACVGLIALRLSSWNPR